MAPVTVRPSLSTPLMATMLGIVCTLWSASAFCAPGAESGTAGPAVQVDTVPAKRAPMMQTVRVYGIVAASSANLTSISLSYPVRVLRVSVQRGETVKRGQPLFVIQADSAAALAAEQAISAAQVARDEFSRTKTLFDDGLATASQLDAARKTQKDAQQALALQLKSGIGTQEKTLTAPSDGVVTQLTAGQGDQIAAGTPLLQLSASGSGGNKQANVMLGVEPDHASRIHIGDTLTLRGLSPALSNAPVKGRVTLVGGAIDSQTQLVNIGADAALAGTPYLPGMHVAADITLSSQAESPANASTSTSKRTGTGSGKTIGKTTSRNGSVSTIPSAAPGAINTAAATQTVHWIIPRAALLSDAKGAYVYQIAPDMTAARIKVVTAVENGRQYGVDGDLHPAWPLVVLGNYELSQGAKVIVSGGTKE